MRAKVAYILIITVAGMLFLFRESVNTYWMQTYHQDSPLMEIERWIAGKKQNPHLVADEPAEVPITEQSAGELSSLIDSENEVVLSAKARAQDVKEIVSPEATPVTMPEVEVEEEIVMGFVGPELPQLPSTRDVHAGDKLFFVGDSMMQGVAPRIKQALYQKEGIDGVDLSKQSTGLSYPNFYNWPKVVAETLAKDSDIRVMVVYLGANDPWDFPIPGRKQYLRFKSPEWERAYRSRIRQLLLSAKEYDIPVIWLGAPCMRKDKLHQDMVYLNRLYQDEVERFNGYYLPTSEILGCSDAGYATHVTTDKGQQRVRANDGIHFTVAGQRLVGNRVIDLLSINIQDEENLEAIIESAVTSEGEVKRGEKDDYSVDNSKKVTQSTSKPVSQGDRTIEKSMDRSLHVNQREKQAKSISSKEQEGSVSGQGGMNGQNGQNGKSSKNITPPLQLQSAPEFELEREYSPRRLEKSAEKRAEKPVKREEERSEVLLWEWADGSPIEPTE